MNVSITDEATTSRTRFDDNDPVVDEVDAII
jgi:hypothetical protein